MRTRLTIMLIVQSLAPSCAADRSISLMGTAVAADAPSPLDANAENYPIITVEPKLICSDMKFLTADGELKQGTKTCGNAAFTHSENLKPENIKAGIVISGVVGLLEDSTSFANCTSDGQFDCVTTDSYKSVLTSSLADKIIGGQSIAGVAGTATFPSADKVLSTQSYGPIASPLTGTLTLPPAALVRASQGVYGPAGNAVVALLASCGGDGEAGCVVLGPTYAALHKTAGAEDKIIAGQTLGGVNGTVVLPATGKVLSGISYGVSGTGSSGSLVLPLASQVKSTASPYGDPTAQLTPSYVADFPSPANVRSNDTSNGVTGALLDCLANAAVGCVSTSTYKSGDLTNLNAGNIKAGVSIAGQAGDYPSATNLLTGASAATDLTAFGPAIATGSYEFFDSAGNHYTGTVADPGTLIPSFSNQTISAANTFYRQFVVAGDADLDAANIKLSVDIFGATGTIAGAPVNCTADGTSNCLVDGTNYKAGVLTGAASKILAGTVLAGVTGNVTLPALGKVLSGTSYGVGGTGSVGTLTLPLASNVKSGTAAYGDAAAQTTPAYNPDYPSLANVRNNDTVNGVTGTFGDCTAGNQSACLTTSVFRSMDLSSATAMSDLTSGNFNATLATAANFEFWDSAGGRHQVAGDGDLTAANILTGINIFGVAGSASPAPANCSSNGSQSCVATGSYFAATACAANGSDCFLPTYVMTTQPLKSISYDAIDAGKASMRTSLTLSGITGTLADCTDGAAGCVAASPTYAALLKTDAQDKIISGNTLGSVAGNVTLPAVGKVLASTSFGLSGNGLTGTLTLPLSADVRAGSAAYGDAAAQITPAYSPDFPAVANVLSTDTVNNVAGTLTLPALAKVLTATVYGVGGNGSSGTLTLPLAANVKTGSGLYGDAAALATPAYSPDFPAVGNVLSTDTVDSVAGTLTLPAVGDVLLSTSYGVAGNGSTGALTLPLAANVKTGTAAYGDAAAQLTPTYSPDFPSVANVLSSDTVDNVAGTLTLPAVGKVLATTSYGVAGNGSTGTLNLPLAADVKSGTAAYGDPGSQLTPGYVPDYPLPANVRDNDSSNGVTGTILTCTAGNQSSCVSTSIYKSMDLSAAGVMTDLSAANFDATIATAGNFEFWDSIGGRHQVAGDPELAAANVLTGTNIFGVAGSGVAAPANCSSNGAQSCIATGSYYAAAACSANSSNCFLPTYVTSTQPLKAISYDAIDTGKASIRSSLTLGGVTGTLADCNAGNLTGCTTVSNYKSMDTTSVGTATGLTSSNFNTSIATAANFEFWDAVGARHQVTGDADLVASKVKKNTVIFGVTGDYPSATNRLATNTGATDLTLFITQLTSAGSFEFFDGAGAVYTGSGDVDLVAGNVKSAVAIESLSITGSYIPTLTCPTGWIKVPGDSAYGTGDFCVMKYEAKNVSTVATSQAASTPWVSITQNGSIARCRALGTGYDLISNPQWMTIGANVAGINGNWTGATVGSGYLFAGHTDTNPDSACAAPSNDADFYVETNCTAVSSGDTTEQRRTLTLSNSNVIWDLSGNVWEWVNYINVGDKPGATAAYYEYTAVTGTTTTALKDLVPTNAVKAFWSDAWNSGKYIGRYYPGTNGSGGALLRGGYWDDGSYNGVFAARLYNAPSFMNATMGYRCVLTAPIP